MNIDQQVKIIVENKIPFFKNIKCRVWLEIADQIENQVWAQITNNVYDEIYNQIKNQINAYDKK